MDITYNLYNSGGSRPFDNGMGGGGGGHLDPEIRGVGAVSKIFFSALRASVWPKKRGAGSSPGSATVQSRYLYQYWLTVFWGNCLQFRHPSDKR